VRVADVAALNVCKPVCSRLALVSVPKVGLEPTPSCEDRILSPARLPEYHAGPTLPALDLALFLRGR